MVLLLFYNNNNAAYITDEYLEELNHIVSKSQVQSDAALVLKWVEKIKVK